jgi:ATP-dependent Clp protease ATP-binding subunit ClpX
VSEKNNKCSFCGVPEKDSQPNIHVMGGPKNGDKEDMVFICLKCAKRAETILNKKGEQKKFFNGNLPTPRQLVAYLDQYVIGQIHTKRVISVAVVNHYKRLHSQENDKLPFADVAIKKGTCW